MEKATERIIEKFASKKAKSSGHRGDLMLIGLDHVGMRDQGYLFLAKFYFDAAMGQPSRSELQEAATAFLGSSVVLNPKETTVGNTSVTAQLVSKRLIDRNSVPPPQHFSGIRRAADEETKNLLIEAGDEVNVLYEGRLLAGKATSVSPSQVSVDVSDIGIITVPREMVVSIQRIPQYAIKDQEAYDYFIQLFPEYFTRQLTAR